MRVESKAERRGSKGGSQGCKEEHGGGECVKVGAMRGACKGGSNERSREVCKGESNERSREVCKGGSNERSREVCKGGSNERSV